MLQSVAALALRLHQEVITRVVMRAKQSSSFGYEVAEGNNALLRHVEAFRRLRKEIQQMTLWNSFGSDIELAHDGSTHQGRIDQRGKRHSVEVNHAPLRRRVRQRGSVRPLAGKLDRGRDAYLVG